MKRKATPARIAKLIAAERGHFTTHHDGEFYWFTDTRTNDGSGRVIEESRDHGLEIRIAFNVLAQIGVDDDFAHESDWHIHCQKGAQHMVETIVREEFEYRKAAAELAPIRNLCRAAARACRNS